MKYKVSLLNEALKYEITKQLLRIESLINIYKKQDEKEIVEFLKGECKALNWILGEEYNNE